MFEKILVCLDGSPLAEQILPYAAAEGLYFHSKLILIRVITTGITIAPPGWAVGPGYVLPTPGPLADGYVSEELEEIKREFDEAGAYLDNVAEPLLARGLDVEIVVAQGEAGEAIVSYADTSKIGLITIASCGRSALGRAIFGTTADYVLKNSGLPILLIRPQRVAAPPPEDERPFRKVLVCLDGSRLAEQILLYASEQASRFNSEVVLLRVIPEPLIISPGIPGSGGGPVLTPGAEETIKREDIEARAYLEEKSKELLRKSRLAVSYVTIQGTPGEVIVDYASSNEADLIAMATHGRGGLGRAIFGCVAEYVLRESGLPILLIRPRETNKVSRRRK